MTDKTTARVISRAFGKLGEAVAHMARQTADSNTQQHVADILNEANDLLSCLAPRTAQADVIDVHRRANLARYRCPHCSHVTGWTILGGQDATCGQCGGEFRTVSP